MLTLFTWRDQATARTIQRQANTTWWLMYGAWLGLGVVLAGIAYATAPRNLALALCAFILGAVAILVRPQVGIYLIAFFGALGDGVTAAWYPFTKNLSSQESTLYLTSSISVSPAEVYLALTALAWVLHAAGRREWRLIRGVVFWPVVAFAALVALATMRGLAAGGDMKVALFQARPLLLLAALYVLATNLLDTRRQWRIVLWLLMIALTINSVMSISYLRGLSGVERDGLESLVEHPAAVQMNMMFVLLAASWIYRGTSAARRQLLLILAIPVAYVYIVSQRRAAFVGLAAVAVIGAVMMYWNHRRRFWKVLPVVAVLTVGYLGAFWNVTSGPGFPAQAVKSVLAPTDVSTEDQASDAYRSIENIDLLITIKTAPVLGIGYGLPFYRPLALPDISVFEFYEYIPHNSVLAIWMNTGIFGFLAMLSIFGIAIRAGASVIRSNSSGDDAAMGFTALAFVVMFATFAYVDIAWDARSMIYLALALAMISTMHRTTPEPTAGDEAP
jgi:O-antigen ligase